MDVELVAYSSFEDTEKIRVGGLEINEELVEADWQCVETGEHSDLVEGLHYYDSKSGLRLNERKVLAA